MGIIPFRDLVTAPGNAPPWLRDGTGERWLYPFGLMVDARLERLVQGIMARIPRSDIAHWTAPLDALNLIASDRVLFPGLTESRDSLAHRDQEAFDTWQLAGLPRSILQNVLGYLLSSMPMVRTVATKYAFFGGGPTAVSSTWTTYPEGTNAVGAPTSAPVVAFGSPITQGDWAWDLLSQITGSLGWWSAYVIIYSVVPDAWCQPAQAWGTGSVYTASTDGYYSTVTGGAYVASGSYTGTSQAWGAGTVYVSNASGYYSAIIGGAYTPSGGYNGLAQGWGVSVSEAVGLGIQQIVKQFKPQNIWVRTIIISFSSALFDPTIAADGTHNPASTFGQWSIVTAGAYVQSRFSNAVYGGEVI